MMVRKRFLVFFLVLIYLFNNIFVNSTLCRFVNEIHTEKFNLIAEAMQAVELRDGTLISGPEFYKKIPTTATSVTFDTYSEEKYPDFIWEDGTNVDADNEGNVKLFSQDTNYYVLSFGVIYANPDSSGMLKNHHSLTNINLLNFDTSDLVNMDYMFSGCRKVVELDVSNWDTKNVVSMEQVFGNCSNILTLDVSNWDTSNVVDMDYLFFAMQNVTSLDVSNWDTSNVTNMKSLFDGCEALETIDLSNFDTKKINSLERFFYHCYALKNVDLSNFDTSNVTSLHMMFYGCKSLETVNLSSFDTSNVTSLDYMFADCSVIEELNLSNFNTEQVINMSNAFKGCKGLKTLNLSSFNTMRVTNMTSMFANNSNLEHIYVDNDIWYPLNTVSKRNSTGMFSGCSKLPNFNKSYIDFIKAHAEDGGYLTDINNRKFNRLLNGLEFSETIKSIVNLENSYSIVFGKISDYPNFKNSTGVNVDANDTGIYQAFETNNVVYVLSMDDSIIYANKDSSFMFYKMSKLNNVEFNNISTEYVWNMEQMFAFCYEIENIDVSSFNTENVTNMKALFVNCDNLKEIDLSSFDTNRVLDMQEMFHYCFELTKIVFGDNHTNDALKSVYYMFADCQKLEYLDLSSFDLTATILSYAFYNCVNLKEIIFSNCFNSGGDYKNMFANCHSLTELDLSNFSFDWSMNADNVFYDCYNLEHIFIDPSNWIDEEDTMPPIGENMFYNCLKLPNFDNTVVDFSKAHSGVGGYLTDINLKDTLSLLPPFEMPEGFIAGKSFIISEMPDFNTITNEAIENTPENTVFYGWLIENEIAQQIFEPEDAEYILEDTYSYEEEIVLRLTPVYKVIEHKITIDTELQNVIITNLVKEFIVTEDDLILTFVIDDNHKLQETIEIVLDDLVYDINISGKDNPDGFIFDNETLELIISSDTLMDKENLVIKAVAEEIVEEKETVDMIEGNNSVFEFDSDKTLVFKSEAPLEDLLSVEINGETLTPEIDYIATEGSTVITLTNEYLSSLDLGEYTICIISKEIIAKATFTVKEKVEKEENIKKNISFDIEHLFNIEITEFVDLEEDNIDIEENLELEFVYDEDYVLYKNIEVVIDETSYVIDLTDKEQEIEGIDFNRKDNILTIAYDLFKEESSLIIKAVALEDISIDELLEGEEISITEFVESEDLLNDIEIPENAEFIGWLINGEELEINNIVVQEILNDILTKIYEERIIEQEKVQETENVLEESTEEEIEEIETLLTPIFRLIVEEELALEGYVLGEETVVSEMIDDTVFEEIINSGLTEELSFYGWLVAVENRQTIVLPNEISEILNNLIEEENKEIIITPLYTVVEIKEQPEESEENIESDENKEEITLPEDENPEKDTVSSEDEKLPENEENSGDNTTSNENESDNNVSVEDTETDDIPETSIPSEHTIFVNIDNLSNIDIPELSKENTISITENENLILSFIVEESYELPKTVQIVVDKTYTINTNGEDNPEGIDYNVSTQELTISNSLLTDIDSIKIKGTAIKVQEEDKNTDTDEEKSENTKQESSDNTSSAEKEENQSPVEDDKEVEESTDNSTDTENVENNESTAEQENVNSDIENVPEDTNNEASEEQTNQPIDVEKNEDVLPEDNEETESGSEEIEDTSNEDVNNEVGTDTIEKDVVENVEKDKPDSSTSVVEDKSSCNEKNDTTSSPEPTVKSDLPAQSTSSNGSSSTTETTSQSSGSSSSSSSPDTNSSSTSQPAGTTSKKSESSSNEGNSESTSSEE